MENRDIFNTLKKLSQKQNDKKNSADQEGYPGHGINICRPQELSLTFHPPRLNIYARQSRCCPDKQKKGRKVQCFHGTGSRLRSRVQDDHGQPQQRNKHCPNPSENIPFHMLSIANETLASIDELRPVA